MSAPRGAGRRYPLLLYTRMLDRWWPALLLIGLGTLALAWSLYSNLYTRLIDPWRWRTLAAIGILVVGASLLMLFMRRGAHVQPFGDYLQLVTPFLRLKISYRRIRRVSTAPMATLFPPRSLRGLRRDILEPLFSQMAVVIDMNALPLSAGTLKLFLSPFFFKDATPHIVVLVRNWMGFSTELESMRSGTAAPEMAPRRRPTSILTQLPKRK